MGISDVYMNTDTGCRLRLKNMRNVPEIRLNLISTSTLDDEGYHSYFGEGKWKLTKGSLVVARGKKNSSLYLAEAKSYGGEVNTADDISTHLWHMRLGHISQNGMRMLSKKQKILGLKLTDLEVCTHYLA